MEKTIKNLAAAFIGESQARNRYTIYAKIAKEEGYEQISAIFLDTADQEREHAKWLMRMIQDLKKGSTENFDEIIVESAGCPTVIGNTSENLSAAIGGENHEHTSMYPEFAKTADEEGLGEVSARLLSIAKAEAHHEERYQKLKAQVDAGTFFKKDTEQQWTCRKCGYVHEGNEAPGTCPSCSHPSSYFQIKSETY